MIDWLTPIESSFMSRQIRRTDFEIPISSDHQGHLCRRSKSCLRILCVISLIGLVQACNPDSSVRVSVPAKETVSGITLVDITSKTGVDAVYRNGEEANHRSIVESLGGGIAIIDFDCDGRLDLYFPQGGSFGDSLQPTGEPGSLFRQIDFPSFRRCSRAAVPSSSNQYSHGAAAADYDQDGFVDLLVTGYGSVGLFRNLGDGTFEESTVQAGLIDSQWSSSAAWGDVNGDGNLDLYLTHYVDWSPENHPRCGGPSRADADVCPPRRFRGINDTLYVARGDGTFHDNSRASGLKQAGKGLGVLMADLDADGDLDIYVANDTVENVLYLNDAGGHFTELGMLSGVAVDHDGNATGSMGIALLDADGNGELDLWVTNYEAELFALYVNRKNGQFVHESVEWGLNRLGTLFVGFGTVSADFDLDTDEDLAVANGHVILHPTNAPLAQTPIILENEEQRLLPVLSGDKPILVMPRRGRGLAVGDLNSDGLPDLVFSNINEPASVVQNTTETNGRSVSIRLIGTKSSRVPIGCIVRLRTHEGERVRQLTGGGSYLSTSDERLHFGLNTVADSAAFEVKIEWPSGHIQEIGRAEIERLLKNKSHLRITVREHGATVRDPQ